MCTRSSSTPNRAATTCLARTFRTWEAGPAGFGRWRKSSPSTAAHRSEFCTRFRLLPCGLLGVPIGGERVAATHRLWRTGQLARAAVAPDSGCSRGPSDRAQQEHATTGSRAWHRGGASALRRGAGPLPPQSIHITGGELVSLPHDRLWRTGQLARAAVARCRIAAAAAARVIAPSKGRWSTQQQARELGIAAELVCPSAYGAGPLARVDALPLPFGVSPWCRAGGRAQSGLRRSPMFTAEARMRCSRYVRLRRRL